VKKFLKLCALWLLIAGLPLQNLHAVAMPFCAPVEASAAVQHQPGHGSAAADHEADHHQPVSAAVNASCDGCGLCDVCSAPAIASMGLGISFDAVDVPPAVLPSRLTLFDPEQPQRPPKQS
jgi:hypothetical protein